MTRPRDEWRQDVSGRYKVLEHFSKEDARLQFLRILRSLPYGVPALVTLEIPYACCHACHLTHNTPQHTWAVHGAECQFLGLPAMDVRLGGDGC